jgi:NAD(P)-dependent dehydrogenase (short-subunit alcohol dehydrogenase family)
VKLEGKVALVTGTSPNIGGGIALGLAAEGARVVCLDTDPHNARQCAAHIERQGGQALGTVCDVTDEAQVQAAVTAAQHAYGGVDVLVNAAAIFNEKGVLAMSVAEWSRQIAVLLTGAFLCTQQVARLMIAQGRKGSIINLISTAGYQGQPDNIAYCTAKSGLLNFTRSAAMELAQYGIRVNSLTPTATDPREGLARAAEWGRPWELPRTVLETFEERRQVTPLHVLPSPRHYARAAAFLASDDAELITGTDLRVDAGNVARYWAWTPPPSQDGDPITG